MSAQPAIIDSPPSAAALAHKRRAALELTAGYASILLVLWTPRTVQRPLYIAAVLVLVAVMWLSFQSWSDMGLRRTNLLRSSWIIAAAALCSAVVVLTAVHLHTLHAPRSPAFFISRFWGYALWAFVQQLLLQTFFLRRFLTVTQRNTLAAALAAAAIFALAHLPSPILTTVTFFWGLISCLVFLRYRNLIPISIAHAMLGICLAVSIPAPVIHNMRVGLGYLTYRSHPRLSAATPTTPYPRTHE